MLRSGTEAEAAGQELGSLWEELESLAAATEAERTRRMVRAAEDMPAGWLELGLSERRRPEKERVTLRLDADVAAWFRGLGRGYQTRINAVLRAYVQARKAGVL